MIMSKYNEMNCPLSIEVYNKMTHDHFFMNQDENMPDEKHDKMNAMLT